MDRGSKSALVLIVLILAVALAGPPPASQALLITSPAVNGGSPSCFRPNGSGLWEDQRGFSRPTAAGAEGPYCDIGVMEMQGSPRLTVAIVGEGRVDSDPAGIDCGADCEETYWDSTVVTLTDITDGGSHLVSWSGDCEGADPACAVRMYTGRTVTTTFGLDRARVYLPLVRKE